MKLKYKLMLGMIALLLILFISNELVVLNNVQNEMKKDKYTVYGQMAKHVLHEFEQFTDNMEYSFFDFCKTESIANLLSSEKAAAQKRVQLRWKLDSFLSQHSESMDNVFILDLSSVCYFSSKTGQAEQEHLYSIANELMQKNDVYWFSIDDEMYLSRAIYTFAPYVKKGYLIGKMNSDYIYSYTGMSVINDGVYCICSRENSFLFSYYNDEIIDQLFGSVTINDLSVDTWRETMKDGQVIQSFLSESKRGHWLLVFAIQNDAMMARYNSILRNTIYVFILLVVVGLIISLIISYGMTLSISRLIKSIRRIHDGDNNEIIRVKGHDEVAKLANQYNELLSYQAEVMKARYELLELQYRFIQSQISPHFMSNILSSISSYSLMGKAEQMDELCIKTSRYLKSRLRVGDQRFITMSEEMDSVEDYIEVFRLINVFPVRFERAYKPELNKIKILSIILQPLVENALIHAAEGCKEELLVSVEAAITNDYMQVSVIDNGCGMSDEILKKIGNIKAEQNDSQSIGGFGIGAVIHRLRLQYGVNYDFEVETEIGKGTRINIRYPLQDDEKR